MPENCFIIGGSGCLLERLKPRARRVGGWLATTEASPSALPLRWLDEVVALVDQGPDGPLDIGIVRNRPARQGCRIGAIALITEDGQPAVGSLPEHDVVVAISPLEDSPVGASDRSPVLGE